MKITTIVLAAAMALSSTLAFAQGAASGGPTSGGTTAGNTSGSPMTSDSMNRGSMNRGSMDHRTTGMGSGDVNGPNGAPGGATSLSGTGSSQYGGETPGGANGR